MVRLTQNSFLGGQLDFELMGRQDFARYAKGASKLRNFNIMKRGGLQKRQGFDKICDLKSLCGITSSDKVRLIPYAYKKTQGFVLVLAGLKMYVVGTNPNNVYKLYSVTDGSNIYSSTEIGEIDYQQSGDVIFLAHQNHPPARIVHIIDDAGEDGFYYEVMEVNRRNDGIPSITNANISRTAVECSGGTYTEKYRATAVFDGVETFPCEIYSDSNVANNSASWKGTTYYLPFTESQKIRLTIRPAVRYDEDGVIEYPTEIRVYKKAFDYFGLIGVIELDLKNTRRVCRFTSLPTTKYENSDIGTSADLYAMSDDVADYGDGRTAYSFAEGNHTLNVSEWTYSDGKHYALTWASNTWTLADFGGTTVATVSGASNLTTLNFTVGDATVTATKSGVVRSGFVTLGLGSAFYTVAEDNASVTFTYKGWTATSLTAKLGDGEATTAMLPSSSGDKTQTVEKGEDEEDSAFLTRWKDLYRQFVAALTDTATVTLNVSQTSAGTGTSLSLTVAGGDLVVNHVTAKSVAAVSDVFFDDKYITPSTSTTPPEDDGEEVFSGTGNYPAAVSLSQQRLVWASSKNDPARIWLSQIGDFYTYTSHEIQLPDDPIDFIMPVTRFAKINHIAEMRKLLMFNSACEWLVDSASSSSGITYETIQAYPQSYSGSNERLKPIVCNNSLLFSERTGQTVRRFAYDLSNDGFAGKDVSVLSYSIFENNPIVDWTYQQFPFSTLWCALADGTFASFEFMEEQDILAWATHSLGGGGKIRAMATSYGVAPALDLVKDTDAYEKASHEEVFAVVVRGDDVWLERMRVKSEASDSVYHSLCLDSVRVLNSLNNYTPGTDENLTFIPKNTTDGKPITREEALTRLANGEEVYEGYAFDAEFVSCFPVIASLEQATVGVGQIDIKNVQNVAVRLAPSYGGVVRSWNFGKTDGHEERIRYDDNPSNDCSAEFGGDGTVVFHECDCPNVKPDGMNTRDGRVYIRQGDVWPFGILMYELDIEPENGGWNGH